MGSLVTKFRDCQSQHNTYYLCRPGESVTGDADIRKFFQSRHSPVFSRILDNAALNYDSHRQESALSVYTKVAVIDASNPINWEGLSTRLGFGRAGVSSGLCPNG